MTALAELYTSLAEAIAEPPEWLAAAGREWPLFDAAARVASDSNPRLREAAVSLVEIDPEPLGNRQLRYRQVIEGNGRPRVWLHESLAREGRLAGPLTFAVGEVYEAAGLSVVGAELPDNASMELAFLGYLVEREAQAPQEARHWRSARRLFVSRHAAQWLPPLGRELARTGDPVYGPIGRLLVAVIDAERRPTKVSASTPKRGLPHVPDSRLCNLCGFCVQICPTNALMVEEIGETTTLLLDGRQCIACERCARICETRALIVESHELIDERVVLRESTRERCLGCGQPTVSQAEMDAIAARIGNSDWLSYCPECRPHLVQSAS